MEVPLQDKRLDAGAHKEQRRVEVALPVGGAGVVHKLDQQPEERAGDTLIGQKTTSTVGR